MNHLAGITFTERYLFAARQRQWPCVIIDDVLTHIGRVRLIMTFTQTAKRFNVKMVVYGI